MTNDRSAASGRGNFGLRAARMFPGLCRAGRSGVQIGHDADLQRCRGRAGLRFSRLELHAAAVGEFDIAADRWSTAFDNVFRSDRKPHWQARGSAHPISPRLHEPHQQLHCETPACAKRSSARAGYPRSPRCGLVRDVTSAAAMQIRNVLASVGLARGTGPIMLSKALRFLGRLPATKTALTAACRTRPRSPPGSPGSRCLLPGSGK